MNIQDIKLEQVSQIYVGKDHNCRCGCAGTYVATSFMENPRTDVVDDKKALARLRRAKKLALRDDSEVEFGSSGNEIIYINVGYGNNRAYTIYFDEIKQN